MIFTFLVLTFSSLSSLPSSSNFWTLRCYFTLTTLGFQSKEDFCLIRDIFICSNRKTVATPWTCSLRCMQQQLTEVFQSCWKQLSIENLRTSLWVRLCLSNMEMSKKNVNLIIVKWHFLQVIALLTVHCIIFSRHDWIASCSVIATGKLKWYVKSEKVLNASRW